MTQIFVPSKATPGRRRESAGFGCEANLTKHSAAAEAEFGEFASAQAGQLFRIAYLICGDWHEAEDLVQTTLTKLFVAWGRAGRADHVGSYARSVLVNCYLSSRRLRRQGELPVAEVLDSGISDCDTDLRLTLVAALRRPPPRSRAVVVLRYLEDLSIETVASYLGTTPAAVKSLNTRGIAQLREYLGAKQTGSARW
jgi:RNA polymerase sigma-70 factor (sigma-E family)